MTVVPFCVKPLTNQIVYVLLLAVVVSAAAFAGGYFGQRQPYDKDARLTEMCLQLVRGCYDENPRSQFKRDACLATMRSSPFCQNMISKQQNQQ